MENEQKSHRYYDYKHDCGAHIEIDSESEECSDFFHGKDEENKRIILQTNCPNPNCGKTVILQRSDIGKTILPLFIFKGVKWEIYWKNS
ncbi:MAG: hypothetical protein H8E32_12620 [Nitrospinae bacterium]|nr:hypothetical protein [Nitrospinota bacterium]